MTDPGERSIDQQRSTMASKSRVSPVLFPAIATAMVVLLVASAVAPSHGAPPAAASSNGGVLPAPVEDILQELGKSFQNFIPRIMISPGSSTKWAL